MALTEAQVRKLLRKQCDGAGSQHAFAKTARLNRGHLSEALAGKRGMSPAILKALGLRKVVRYERGRAGHKALAEHREPTR